MIESGLTRLAENLHNMLLFLETTTRWLFLSDNPILKQELRLSEFMTILCITGQT